MGSGKGSGRRELVVGMRKEEGVGGRNMEWKKGVGSGNKKRRGFGRKEWGVEGEVEEGSWEEERERKGVWEEGVWSRRSWEWE